MTLFTVALCLCSLGWSGAVREPPLPLGLHWQTIEAAHFRVIFPAGLEGLAQEAVVALEAARDALQERGYVPTDKIDLVLHDSSDLGEVTVDVLSNRILLSVAQAECAAPVESLLQAAIFEGYESLVRRSAGPDAPQILRPWLRLWRAWRESGVEALCDVTDASPLQIPSPDGQQILTLKRDWYQHFYFYGDLYLFNRRTGREERLTEGARVYRAAFFPDGQRVLVAQYRWGDRGPVLSVLDIQTKEITLLKEFSLHDYFPHSLAVSPDGKTLALSLWRRGGFQDIYLSPSPPPWPSPYTGRERVGGEGWGEGGVLHQITRDRVRDFDPVFSSDGHFVLFSRGDPPSQRYAYRLADGTFFRVGAHLDSPLQWEPVQLHKEPFPSWEGFPETDYPVAYYDPRTTLEPKLWIPLLSLTSVGLAAFGEDALRHHRYQFALGFDWRRLEPFYRLRYEDQQSLLGFGALLQKGSTGSHQRATATLPLLTKVSAQHQLSLFYHREEQEKTAHTIGLIWSGIFTLAPSPPPWPSPYTGRERVGGEGWGEGGLLEFSLMSQTRTRTGQRLWENSLSLQLQGTLSLAAAHELKLLWRSADAYWRIGYSLALQPRLRGVLFVTAGPRWGGELEFVISKLWSPRLGILWGVTEKPEFYLTLWGD